MRKESQAPSAIRCGPPAAPFQSTTAAAARLTVESSARSPPLRARVSTFSDSLVLPKWWPAPSARTSSGWSWSVPWRSRCLSCAPARSANAPCHQSSSNRKGTTQKRSSTQAANQPGWKRPDRPAAPITHQDPSTARYCKTWQASVAKNAWGMRACTACAQRDRPGEGLSSQHWRSRSPSHRAASMAALAFSRRSRLILRTTRRRTSSSRPRAHRSFPLSELESLSLPRWAARIFAGPKWRNW